MSVLSIASCKQPDRGVYTTKQKKKNNTPSACNPDVLHPLKNDVPRLWRFISKHFVSHVSCVCDRSLPPIGSSGWHAKTMPLDKRNTCIALGNSRSLPRTRSGSVFTSIPYFPQQRIIMEHLELDEHTTVRDVVNVTLDNERTAERFPDHPTQVACRAPSSPTKKIMVRRNPDDWVASSTAPDGCPTSAGCPPNRASLPTFGPMRTGGSWTTERPQAGGSWPVAVHPTFPNGAIPLWCAPSRPP